eukprot:1680423-Prymnesium_polylepis.1
MSQKKRPRDFLLSKGTDFSSLPGSSGRCGHASARWTPSARTTAAGAARRRRRRTALSSPERVQQISRRSVSAELQHSH